MTVKLYMAFCHFFQTQNHPTETVFPMQDNKRDLDRSFLYMLNCKRDPALKCQTSFIFFICSAQGSDTFTARQTDLVHLLQSSEDHESNCPPYQTPPALYKKPYAVTGSHSENCLR